MVVLQTSQAKEEIRYGSGDVVQPGDHGGVCCFQCLLLLANSGMS